MTSAARVTVSHGGPRLFVNALTLSFVIFLMTTSFPNLTLSTPNLDFTVASENDLLRYAPVALALFAIIDFLQFSRISNVISSILRGNRASSYLLFLAIAILLVSSFAARPQAIFNSIVFIFLICNFDIFWRFSPEQRSRLYQWSSIILFLYLLGAMALYGLPNNRWVGGIHPNIYAAAVLPAAMFGHMGFKRLGLLLFCLGFALALAVSSRYAMLALLAYIFIFYALRFRSLSSRSRLLLILAFFSLIPLAIAGSDFLGSAAMLDDPTRGVNSGLSGRASNYSTFWPQFEDNFIIGFGFRMRAEYLGAHNGYLNSWLENGFFLGTLLNLFVFLKPLFSLNATFAPAANPAERCSVLSAFLAISIGAFFQPQLINFGDPMGISFLFFATSSFYGPRLEKASQFAGAARLQPAARGLR